MTRRTTEQQGCLLQIATAIGLGLLAAGFVAFMSFALAHSS